MACVACLILQVKKAIGAKLSPLTKRRSQLPADRVGDLAGPHTDLQVPILIGCRNGVPGAWRGVRLGIATFAPPTL